MTTRDPGPRPGPLSMSHLRLSRKLCPFRPYSRSFAAISSDSPPPTLNTVGPYQVFDRSAKVIQRDNAARREGGARSRTVDYVRDEVAERMLERFMVCSTYEFPNARSCTMLNTPVKDIKRKFGTVIDLGSGPGHFSKLLETDKIQKSVMLDSSGNG